MRRAATCSTSRIATIPSVPTPLVITLHGFAQWPANQAAVSRWNRLADEYGFIVVYPAGTSFPLRWRTSDDTGAAKDVAFISDLIDTLSAEYNIDPARIYANGISNGGGMSFLLSCRLSERIAAFGSVAGAFSIPWEACNPSRPMPAILFHGTADPIVPYQGGPAGPSGSIFPSIPAWVAEFARRNGCDASPQDLPASGDVSGVRYTGCLADVVFYTIAGGGHSWPGGGYLPKFIVGETTARHRRIAHDVGLLPAAPAAPVIGVECNKIQHNLLIPHEIPPHRHPRRHILLRPPPLRANDKLVPFVYSCPIR